MFLRNALAYSGTTFLGQACGLVQKLAVRRLLPPAAIGVWELVSVIQGVATTLDPGVNTAAGVELPLLDGAGALEEERRVRATALVTNVALSLLLAAGVLVYTIAVLGRSRATLAAGLVASLTLVPASVYQTLVTFLQGKQRYVALSKASVMYAVAAALLLPAGAAAGGTAGLLCAAVVAAGLQAALLFGIARGENLVGGRDADWGTLRRLLRFGLPLRLADAPQGVFTILDSLVVSALLGLGPLGLYGIVRSFFLQVAGLPAMAGNVFVMRTFHRAGARTARTILAAEARTFLRMQALIAHPLLIVLMVPAYRFLVAGFIPAYAASVPVIESLAFAIYFLPQTTLIRNFWMLERRIVSLGLSNVVGLATMAGGLTVAVAARGLDLVAVADGTVLGYLGYYLYVMLTVGRELWGLRPALGVVFEALFSLAVTKLVLGVVSPGAPWVSPTTLAGSALASLLCLAPLFLYGAWRTRLLDHLRRDVGWDTGTRRPVRFRPRVNAGDQPGRTGGVAA